MEDFLQPVYNGCGLTRLHAGVVMNNLYTIFGIPHSFQDELLTYLATDLLPDSNSLPRSTYQLQRMIMKLGLQYTMINCCFQGPVLCKGDVNEGLLECPTCDKPWYMEGSDSIPWIVLRYFPIIPRLKRMFRC